MLYQPRGHSAVAKGYLSDVERTGHIYRRFISTILRDLCGDRFEDPDRQTTASWQGEAVPLLKNRKCIVHAAKPAVCAMFPIGRCLVAENPEEGLWDFSKARLQYIFTNPGCGNQSETHTVGEYLESFGISVEDEFFMEWQRTVLRLGDMFRKIEKEVRLEVMEQVWTAAFIGLYLHYDTEEDFMPQFEGNARKFFDMLDLALRESGYDLKV